MKDICKAIGDRVIEMEEDRKNLRMCLYCYTFRRNNIPSGWTMNETKCHGCGKEIAYKGVSSAVYCPECSDKHGACIVCGHSIEVTL